MKNKKIIINKHEVFIFTLLLLILKTHAQIPCNQYEWVASIRGNQEVSLLGMDIDSSGNAYMTGNFRANTNFGSTQLTSQGRSDFYLSKVNELGHFSWIKTAGGPFHAVGLDLKVVDNKYIFVTGFFDKEGVFGDDTLRAMRRSDLFVSKLTVDGDWLWSKTIRGLGNVVGNSIEVNAMGDIFVAGYFDSTVYVNDKPILNDNNRDAFLAKMDSTGELIWFEHWGGNVNEISTEVALNQNQEPVVTGIFQDDFLYQGVNFSSRAIFETFVIAFTDDGNMRWGFQTPDGSACSGQSIAIDNFGNIYVTGFYRDTTIFNNETFVPVGDDDFFVLKLKGDGEVDWFKSAGGSEIDRASHVSIDHENNIYITGHCRRTVLFDNSRFWVSTGTDGFVAKLSPQGEWLKFITSSAFLALGSKVRVNSNDDIFFAGRFGFRGDFGTHQLYAHGSFDGFLAKINCHASPTTSTYDFTQTRLNVYPNPSTDKRIVISSQGMKSYSITNANGVQLVARMSTSSQEELDLSQYPAGMYFLTAVYENNTREVKKVLLK